MIVSFFLNITSTRTQYRWRSRKRVYIMSMWVYGYLIIYDMLLYIFTDSHKNITKTHHFLLGCWLNTLANMHEFMKHGWRKKEFYPTSTLVSCFSDFNTTCVALGFFLSTQTTQSGWLKIRTALIFLPFRLMGFFGLNGTVTVRVAGVCENRGGGVVGWSWKLHPGRLTWNITMEVWKIIFLSKWFISRFHVNLPGCTCNWMILGFFSSWDVSFKTLLGWWYWQPWRF